MSKFESSIRQIEYPQQIVFQGLSNLDNLSKVQDRIPEDKAKDLSFDNDSVSINVPPVGKITLRIVEREEPKTIKFETVESPLPFNFWIQLLPVTETSCKMKLTIKADLNPFIKAMVSSHLQDGIEKIADVLQMIKYE
ncbi:MAG: SRPBCC family protein [Prevotella sp.]|nr:SRPBCC family protein [Prevotella sp.]MBQ5511748.1 SRPBCC family protein [Prevotella sp.]